MASFDKPNAQTLAEILSMDPKLQKEVWASTLVKQSNNYSVLYDNMVGPVGSGKAFIQHNDLTVKEGNTVNIPLLGGARGKGVQGSGDRVGQEKKMKGKTFAFKVGRWWHGFAIESVATEETLIGTQWDQNAYKYLQQIVGIKKTDDMFLELRVAATARNTVYAGGVQSRDALRSTHTFSTTTVRRAATVLTSLGAKPVSIGLSTAGAKIRQFMFLGTQFFLESFETSQTYLDAVTNADVRGSLNALFTGNILPYNGHAIYKWDVEDPDDVAPSGCPLLRRAFLGTAIASGTTAVDVTGGGSAANAADTDVQYFGYFSNAAITGCEGQKLAADTTTIRYGAIQNGNSIFYFSFKVNNGNKLTMFERLGSSPAGAQVTTLTGSSISWGSGTIGSNNVTLTDTAPIGSLIVEVNSAGVPFAEGLGLGEMAGVMGHGSIDGAQAIARRTEYHAPHDVSHAIGVETVFGTKAFQRLDGQVGGYVYVVAALQLPGFPII